MSEHCMNCGDYDESNIDEKDVFYLCQKCSEDLNDGEQDE